MWCISIDEYCKNKYTDHGHGDDVNDANNEAANARYVN